MAGSLDDMDEEEEELPRRIVYTRACIGLYRLLDGYFLERILHFWIGRSRWDKVEENEDH